MLLNKVLNCSACAASRFFAQRTILKNHSFQLVQSRSRNFYFSPFMAEKALEELRENPFFEKYAKKISKKQQENPAEFISKLEELGQQHNQPDKQKQPVESKLGTPKPDITTPSQTREKNLNDIMKVELLQEKSAEEISKIWTEYYKNKENTLCAVVPSHLYTKQHERSQEYNFIFPLPRDEGYEFILAQFAGHEIHFATLISYQAYGENAPECLTASFYTDLNATKNIVLMKGEYDKNILKPSEAQFLINQVQLYYTGGEDYLELLKTFKHKPDQFQYSKLVEKLESTNFITG